MCGMTYTSTRARIRTTALSHAVVCNGLLSATYFSFEVKLAKDFNLERVVQLHKI